MLIQKQMSEERHTPERPRRFLFVGTRHAVVINHSFGHATDLVTGQVDKIPGTERFAKGSGGTDEPG